MPVTFPNATAALHRAVAYDLTQPWTHAFWVQTNGNPAGASKYFSYSLYGDNSYGSGAPPDYLFIGSEDTSTASFVENYNGSAEQFSPDTLPIGVFWTYLAVTSDGTTLTLFVNSVAAVTCPLVITLGGSDLGEYLGNDLSTDFGSVGGLSMCYERVWQRALSATELAIEQVSPLAVTQTNLLADCPLLAPNAVDDETNQANGWALRGSPTAYSGTPPVAPVPIGYPRGSLVVGSGLQQVSIRETAIGAVLGPFVFGGTTTGSGRALDATDAGIVIVGGPTIDFYAADGSFLASSPNLGLTSNVSVRVAGSHLYASQSTISPNNGVFQQFSAAGALLTSWTVTDAYGTGAFAVSPDESTAYYVTGAPGPTSVSIARYDLVHSSPLTPLDTRDAGGSNIFLEISSLLTCPDGSVLACWLTISNTGAGTTTVRHYASDGTLLGTWAQPSQMTPRAPALARSLTPTTSVWLQLILGAGGSSTFSELALTDGSVLRSVTVPTEVSTGAFSLWRGIGPPQPPAPDTAVTGYPIRCLRRSPHLTSEQVRVIYDSFQLDVQPGTNAVLTLRYSDDGGFTWSNDVLLTTGGPGNYSNRAIAYQLGQARDRVFEVSTTDPGPVVWIAAYLKSRTGTS